jgi:superfamily II DNA or RNA helicase
MVKRGEYWRDTKGRALEVLDTVLDPYTKQEMVVFIVVGEPDSHLVMDLQKFSSGFTLIQISAPNIEQRLDIFKRLFKGRKDVYAIRYFDKQDQIDKYAPARDFETRNLLRLTDGVIRQHLQGKKFIGLYPLAGDNRTQFLVIDIDKQNWREIVPAIGAVFASLNQLMHAEVSQSGTGAHIWVFFSEPIFAHVARNFGQVVLQRAMQLNPRMDFDAFDRMLPNQDFLPNKGFGNLIAAPLNGQRVPLGRSVFVDEQLVPITQQWEYLGGIRPISGWEVEQMTDALREAVDFQITQAPFEKMSLAITIDNYLRVNIEDLSDIGFQQLRLMATFDNPEYFRYLRARRSVYKTARYISLAEYKDGELLLPRGTWQKIENSYNVPKVVDHRHSGANLDATFTGELYPEQKLALEGALEVDQGILIARTGFGKTVVAANLIAERGVSTLIVVPNTELANQWVSQLDKFLAIENEPEKSYTASGRERKIDSKIGRWFGQKKQTTGLVDVITIQSLTKMDNLAEFYEKYGMVIFDEVHHTAAFTYDEVVKAVAAKYLYGLTATFSRADELTKIISLRFGEIVFESAKIETETLLNIDRRVVVKHSQFGKGHPELEDASFVQLNQELMFDRERNNQIIDQVRAHRDEKQLVLVNRVSHADVLAGMLVATGVQPIVITGKTPRAERKAFFDAAKANSESFVLIATGSIAGEGLDLPDLTVLHLTAPRSFAGTITQYLGRLERNLHEKKRLTVVDYADVYVPMLRRMYLNRLKTYRTLGYQVIDVNHEEP